MPEAEPIPCHNCMLRTTSEFNFLLNCCICKRGFHHRCCRPPIPDEVLTSLIKATLKKKPGKGVKFWKCYTCREGKPPASVQPSRQPSSASNLSLDKDEVIVISDDEPDIVVSSRPPSRKRDTQCEKQQMSSIPTSSAAGGSSGLHTCFPQNNSMLGDLDQDPPLPSTSRFGLLSPPISASGSSVRHPSSTPFFLDNDERGSSKAEQHPETVASARVTLPTPPISARPSVSLAPKSSVSSTWAQPAIVDNDLRILSDGFKEAYRRPARFVQSTIGQRRPRKPVAKQLDKNNKTPGQRSYCRIGIPD